MGIGGHRLRGRSQAARHVVIRAVEAQIVKKDERERERRRQPVLGDELLFAGGHCSVPTRNAKMHLRLHKKKSGTAADTVMARTYIENIDAVQLHLKFCVVTDTLVSVLQKQKNSHARQRRQQRPQRSKLG